MKYIFKTGGAVTVTTAGTRVQVSATNTPVVAITFQALKSNTGKIYVGDSSVASSNGIALDAGESVEIVAPQVNGTDGEVLISNFYLDSSVSGEKATIHYFIR